MHEFTFGVIFVLCLTLIALRSKSQTWKQAMLLVLFGYVLFEVFFGGDSLRSHADLAKAQGRTQEYIEGLARMNKAMLPVKGNMAVAAFAILVIALVGMRKK